MCFNMKGAIGAFALVLLATSAHAADAEREASLQMSRYDQMIGRLTDSIERLQSDVRTLQRENAALVKKADAAEARANTVADQMQTLRNVEFGNIQAQQKQFNERLIGQSDRYDWGSAQRDCAELGVKHQQIKTQSSPDGLRAVQFLCYDGKLLHLGTEMNVVGE